MVLVFVGLLLLSSLKDLKDYAGDRADNVYTLFTILGMRRGKIVIAIATFVAIMLFPIILRSPDLLFLSAAIGVAEMFLIFDKKIREKWIIGLLFVYVVLVYLIAF